MTRDAITRFVFMRDEPVNVDLALVLGSPSISNIEPAIALYHAGLTRKLLITGHGPTPDSEPEWRLYRDHAVLKGVPQEDILIESAARNTAENMAFSARIMAEDLSGADVRTIAICCKPIHCRRVYMTARRHLPQHIALLMIPPENPMDIQASDWWKTPKGQKRVLGEIMRIGEYGLKEDLSID